MSRLIVKNLPKNINEDKLRSIFSQKGTITDIQLKYTPKGKFRQFAFVGYQKEDEATAALEYFDKMCINTNRLSVEKCASLGDTNKPKPWSKYTPKENSLKQEVEKEKKPKKKKTDLLEKYKSDPMFEEFMKLHSANIEKGIESSHEDEAVDSDEKDETVTQEETEQEKLACKEISDKEYMKNLIKSNNEESTTVEIKPKEKKQIELFTVKLRGLAYTCKKKDIKHFFHPNTPFTIRLPPKVKGIAYVGFKTEKQMNKALLKNKSFIGGKRILISKYSKQDSENQNSDTKKAKWKTQEESLLNEESIAESGRIFLRNLPYTVTEEDIQEIFSKYGPVTEINLPVDSATRKIKGFAIVTYLLPEHAVRAYTELDGSIFHGRMLHLLPGKTKDTSTAEDLEESSNYKQKKKLKEKQQAGQSHNWNSLFLGQNAVAEVIADTYGVSKEDVLKPHDDGAAIRLALGETQIVASTRKYLEEHGVFLDAFNSRDVKRSKCIILVKNLPHQTSIAEMRELFAKHGVISRIILPPSGITAIVEFEEQSEAKKAFTKLAYTKFKNVPLYLEWAPENCLVERKADTEKIETTEKSENNDKSPVEEQVEDDEEPEENTTIFVKNLSFDTTNERLKKHFECCGKIHYAKVATKQDKNNAGQLLSMGFGFVQFKTKEGVNKALKTLQMSELDGKSLELKRSERTLKEEQNSNRKKQKQTKQTGTKILVKNIPFQASQKEIRELFSTFGELKAVRMPKKMAEGPSQHRGFAFIDFVTESNAKAAFEALRQSTHLYGRRLVLEWAEVEEDVTQIRKRTADHFAGEKETKTKKKSVLDLNDTLVKNI